MLAALFLYVQRETRTHSIHTSHHGRGGGGVIGVDHKQHWAPRLRAGEGMCFSELAQQGDMLHAQPALGNRAPVTWCVEGLGCPVPQPGGRKPPGGVGAHPPVHLDSQGS